MFDVFNVFLTPPHVEHQERALVGAFLVFGLIITSPLTCFSPPPSCRTRRAHPSGRVRRAQHEGGGDDHAEHQERALVGAFLVSDVRGGEEDVKHVEHAPKGVLDVREGVRNRPNTKNAPTRARSWCSMAPLPFASTPSAAPSPSPHPQHGKRDIGSRFPCWLVHPSRRT